MPLNIADHLTGFLEGVRDKASGVVTTDNGVRRRDQILAAIGLPFIIVLLAGFATVIKQVVDGVVSPSGPLGFTSFLIGAALVCGVFAGCFAWVKTGGFGIFAR